MIIAEAKQNDPNSIKIKPASSGSEPSSKAWNKEHNEIQNTALSQLAYVLKI